MQYKSLILQQYLTDYDGGIPPYFVEMTSFPRAIACLQSKRRINYIRKRFA